MMIVGFLQNAWSPLYAGGKWPRESWLKALHRSRSGQRLAILMNAAVDCEFWFDNTTPIVGATSCSVVQPDLYHMRCVLDEQTPTAIVAFGKQSAKCVMTISENIPVMLLPHPAFRLLSNELYRDAGELLSKEWSGIIEMKQHKGTCERLNWNHGTVVKAKK